MSKYLMMIFTALWCAALVSCGGSRASYEVSSMDRTAPYATGIVRNPVTKRAALVTDATGPWVVYEIPKGTGNAMRHVALTGTGAGTYPLPETYTDWTQFAFEAEGEITPLAERHLPMRGGYNFRDLGGMKGAGGKSVVWGKLFRSDDLQNLTEGDLAYLASIPLLTVVDFRTVKEATAAPDKMPSTRTKRVHFDILPGNLAQDDLAAPPTAPRGEAFMIDLYRTLTSDPHITMLYKDFFALVQNPSNLPLMFHCSAGKDRTGIAAALILFALGVDKETVLADFESSNHYLADKYAALIKENPDQAALYTVNRAYLEAAIDETEKNHGSVEAYLTNALGVDIAAMRARYLE